MYTAGMPEAKMEVSLSPVGAQMKRLVCVVVCVGGRRGGGGGGSGWQMRMQHECFRGKQRAVNSNTVAFEDGAGEYVLAA